MEPDTEVSFESLGLSAPLLDSLAEMGFSAPTPIQSAFIPIAIRGVDCAGQARTGTGKTAAFVIPILERIDHSLPEVQALVLSPTRELSEQVAEECRRLAAGHNCEPALLVGGRPIRNQQRALERCPSIVVGTPGRVIDLMQRGSLKLDTAKIVVLDEADRMLDIGFRPEIEKILRRCPSDRQTLLLSATMEGPVERLAQRYMRDPQRVDVSGDEVTTSSVEQFFCTVDEDKKFGLLVKLLRKERPQQAIVFCRTKRGAERIHSRLKRRLPDAEAIHGDLPQRTRDRVMKKLRSGNLRLLIATDVVGRGIDVSGISHIFNYDIPEHCDDYVHRVGRTGRMSSDRSGRAFLFVTKSQGDELTRIEMRINTLLQEYTFGDFDAFEPRKRRYLNEPEVAPVAHEDKVEEADDEWDSILMDL